jgi:altronate hydrolase
MIVLDCDSHEPLEVNEAPMIRFNAKRPLRAAFANGASLSVECWELIPKETAMTSSSVIRLHPEDNVVIARTTLLPGVSLGENVATVDRIPAGHKVAVRAIAPAEPVRRYGQIIGFASAPIAPGRHVHVHNLEMGDFAKDYAYGVDARPTDFVAEPATFEGIRRPDGKVATRNYIGILTSVNCSAHVAGVVADMFRRNPFTGDDPLADFPNVDGVVALTHKTGCGMTQDEPLRLLRRTLAGYARHPNFHTSSFSASAARSTRSAA